MRTRIFLAEDDLAMRDLLRDELVADGYEIVTSSNGVHTLETLACARDLPIWLPDIILLDAHLPGYSGLQILDALREAGWTTPVILMTAFSDAALRDEAKRSGATAVIEKPFDLTDLRVAVRRCWLSSLEKTD